MPATVGGSVTMGLACVFATTWIGRVAVVKAEGTLDMLTVPRFAEVLDAALESAPDALIADLSAVDFLSSAGMGALISTHEKICGTVRFGVVAVGRITRRPLELVGVDQIVSIHPTVDEALSRLGSGRGLPGGC